MEKSSPATGAEKTDLPQRTMEKDRSGNKPNPREEWNRMTKLTIPSLWKGKEEKENGRKSIVVIYFPRPPTWWRMRGTSSQAGEFVQSRTQYNKVDLNGVAPALPCRVMDAFKSAVDVVLSQ